MSTPKKPDRADEFDRFEDALADSILDASEPELRDEICAAGENPDSIIHSFDAMLVAAKATCATQRLRSAQAQVRAFHATLIPISDADRVAARARFDAIRANDQQLSSKLLLAARKRQGATERDVDSLADDYAELERLEQNAGDKDSDAG